MYLRKLLVSAILTLPTNLHAGIISSVTVDTSLEDGRLVNLQGLEWLSFDITWNVSRDHIESETGGVIDEGWRYATRSETSTLLSSLWGGVTDGWSSDNGMGSAWFLNNFGAHVSHPRFLPDLTRADISFFYGAETECSYSIDMSCLGTVGWKNTTSTGGAWFGSIYLELDSGFFGGYGFLESNYGLDASATNPYVASSLNSNSWTASLMVRSQTVQEPSILILMGGGLFGLYLTRRCKNSKIT